MGQEQHLREKLQDPETFTTTLTVITLDRLGLEAIHWHPMTIRYEILDEFHVTPPPGNLDKLYTGISLLASDDFYRRLPTFIKVCNILSGGQFQPGRFDLAEADECAWGITEAVLLAPPEEENEPFSEEILYYIGGVLERENIKNPPDVLRLGKWEKPVFNQLSNQDPEMFQLEYQTQVEEAQQIEDMLRERIRKLLGELESLQLQNGNTANLLTHR